MTNVIKQWGQDLLQSVGIYNAAKMQEWNDNLQGAAKFGDLAKMEALLKNPVSRPTNVNAKDEHNNTPLQEAAEYGHTDCVRLLLLHGADVNAKGHHGAIPLHKAVYYGHMEITQLLLEHGADVNAKNEDGNTPLHFAAKNGREDCVKALLEAGADVNIRGEDGNTPLSWAEKNRHGDIKTLLEDAIANPEKYQKPDTEVSYAEAQKAVQALRNSLAPGFEGI